MLNGPFKAAVVMVTPADRATWGTLTALFRAFGVGVLPADSEACGTLTSSVTASGVTTVGLLVSAVT